MTEFDKKLLDALSEPFPPQTLSWKPGAGIKGDASKAIAMAYVDVRSYMDRLDRIVPGQWSTSFTPWGENKVICNLTICNVTRASTGEFDPDEKFAIAEGTAAEAQAFKRACATFGLGRYLYRLLSHWVQMENKKITEESRRKLDKYYRDWYAKVMGDRAQAAAEAVPQDIVLGEGEESTHAEPAPAAKAPAPPSKPAAPPVTTAAPTAPKPAPVAPKATPAKAVAPAPTANGKPWENWKTKADMVAYATGTLQRPANDAVTLFATVVQEFAKAHGGYKPADQDQTRQVAEMYWNALSK